MQDFPIIDFPTVTLSNGLTVGNFSSPHAFSFEDGSVLPACQPDTVAACSLDSVEYEGQFFAHSEIEEQIRLVRPGFSLTQAVADRLVLWNNLVDNGRVNLVICPRVMIDALRDSAAYDAQHFVTVRLTDRTSKQASTTTFCR